MKINSITEKIEEKKILKKIIEVSEEFLQSPGHELNYQKIADAILYISDAKYAAFSLYDEESKRFTTIAFSAPERIIKKTSALLGYKLLGKEWQYNPVRTKKIKSHAAISFSTIRDYMEDIVSKPVAILLEKTLKIGEIVFIKILKANKIIGNFTLGMAKNTCLENEEYIETFTRQVGLLITRSRSEAKLVKSEEKCRLLIENCHDIVYAINSINGEFTYVSLNLATILGSHLNQIIGKSFKQFVHPDDIAKCEAFLLRTIDTGERQSGNEYRILHADGIWHWHSSNAVPLKDGSCTVIFYEDINSDITKRKEMEADLLNKKIFSEALLESIPGILYVYDDEGNFIECNKKHEEMTGYSREELSQMNPLSWYDDESDIERVKAAIKDVFMMGSGEVEASMRIKNGKKLLMHFTAVRLSMNGKDYFMGVGTDITERKKAEEKLINTQLLLKSSIESPRDMIILGIDTHYNYLFFNHVYKNEMMRIYGKEIEIGKNLFDYVTSEVDILNNRTNYGRALNGESHSTIQEFGDKKRNYYEIFYNPIFNEKNEIMGATTFARDITERKNHEEEILFLSYHDKLTGLYNRRFVEEEIIRLDTKRQLPLSIIMGDLNSLKLTNDTFGHIAGDKIIKETAEVLRKICRSDDILARWGGDEFVVLLPKTSTHDTEDIAQRIKKECFKLITNNIPLGLAIGIATKNEENQNINTIIIDAESNMYKNKLVEKESSASSIIIALEQALFEKSNETLEHANRIKENAIKLGKSIKLHAYQIDELSLLASLHDIGKVAIPITILLKEGRPTEEEWTVIKRHPEIGYNIAQSSAQINHIAKFILACHENWDGSGYPKGLKGDKIPIISRIMFICDAYDVMTSERIYKKIKSKNEAIKELKRCAGTQFDPILVEEFVKIISK
jgi:diguanylate cyclase